MAYKKEPTRRVGPLDERISSYDFAPGTRFLDHGGRLLAVHEASDRCGIQMFRIGPPEDPHCSEWVTSTLLRTWTQIRPGT